LVKSFAGFGVVRDLHDGMLRDGLPSIPGLFDNGNGDDDSDINSVVVVVVVVAILSIPSASAMGRL
jgi:hypothetical protein